MLFKYMSVLSLMVKDENPINTSIHDIEEGLRVSKDTSLRGDKSTNPGTVYYWTEEESKGFLELVGVLDTDLSESLKIPVTQAVAVGSSMNRSKKSAGDRLVVDTLCFFDFEVGYLMSVCYKFIVNKIAKTAPVSQFLGRLHRRR